MQTISLDKMEAVYKRIMTPYKYGAVLEGIPDE